MNTTPGWRMGTLSGIPVYLGRSWVLVALLLVALFGPTVQQLLPALGWWAYVVALAFAVLLLVSVLIHEAAHALVAQRVGFGVSRVVADFWGGHTAHDGAGGTPARSAAVAVVGPLSNAMLAVLGWWGVAALTSGSGPGLLPGSGTGVLVLLTYAFAWSNTFVAVFNLVPCLPLDGGFLLEALVWRLSGSRHLGTLVAGWAGRLLVVLVVIWGLSPVLQGEQVGLLRIVWVLLIGGFLWQGASQAIRSGRHGAAAARRTVGEAAHPVGVVGSRSTLASVPWHEQRLWVVLDGQGRPDGVVDPPSLQRVPRAAWPDTSASAVAIRLPEGWAVPLTPETRLDTVIEVMRSTGSGVIGLLDEQGHPWGVVVADDLVGTRS
ncbi:site-2 protease family protein [Ornithinimicrobium pratense]|uniref:Peptidase M50 n=1 Tax=Ornithinimicrobium pratense TaxID=2593973 RepID=A0A5J6V3Y4_9MICO|nr:site-2 protease family protein [Ornithinimicrobium pratense]QFG68670.1 peptidase M50 [Ornithinimicrobium pratense]